MPSLPSRGADPYRVNFFPGAWKQIGRSSSGAFFAIQEALEPIAGLRLIYQRDDETRTLTLVDIRPVHGEPH